MQMQEDPRENGIILHLSGRIDSSTAPMLEEELNRLIGDGHRKVLLEFSSVTYISSGGLRILLITAKKLREPGDKFGLCCLPAEVYKILRMAGFTSLFPIYPDEGAGLAGW